MGTVLLSHFLFGMYEYIAFECPPDSGLCGFSQLLLRSDESRVQPELMKPQVATEMPTYMDKLTSVTEGSPPPPS
jgi:hypothetical protein